MAEQAASKVPQIRFKGFGEEWETKRVDAFAPLQRGFDLPTTKTKSGRYPVVYSNGVLRSHNEYKCEAPGVVTGRSGTIGKVTFVSVNYWPHNTSLWVTNFFKNDPRFIHYFYVNFRLERFNAGSTIPTLNRNDVHAINASIPTPAEQTKVGEYFRELDSLIGLHQRKHDKLVTLKKAMLQKMFPQPRATTPEIRFKSFSGDWVKKRLGELTPLRGGFAFQSSQFCEAGIPIIKISNVLPDGTVGGVFAFYEEQEKDINYSLPNNAALLAMSGATTGKVSILKKHDLEKFYQNQRVGYFEDFGISDYSFISTLVRSYFFAEKIDSVLVAGAQPNVSSKEINNFDFQIPKHKAEQQKIGTYFRTLDELISQHATQLQKLQQIKSACLEKMFV